MISLALSLDAGLLWYLQPVAKGNLELEAEVGIERLWWRMTLILWLILQVIQADCVTIGVPGFHLVY
jgi:hypothetical protein